MAKRVAVGGTVYFTFPTQSLAGVKTTLSGSPVVAAYKNGSTTQSTAGITLTVNYDGVTGLNHVAVDTSADGTFYADGSEIELVITTGTVDSISVVGETVASFVMGPQQADVVEINSSAAAASRLALSAGVIIPGTVDTTSLTPTTVLFEADDITESTSQHFNGRVIIFTSGVLIGQATSISDYSLVGGRGRFTVVALTEAPGNNDTFIII